MAEPTHEELLDRIKNLERLVTTEPQMDLGPEHSFPTKDTGISQEQHQQMEVANGDGVLITDGSENPFRLEKHESDAVTNEKGTLIIRVSPTTKRNEARLAGFYFRMTEDREMEFPSVSRSTTYYVCITYDPRKFKEEPLKLERYTDSIPTENNRQHILLHTVEREPNQLLSQARITMYRQYVSPTITVVSESRLPEPTDVLYGTLGIVRSTTSGGDVVPGTGSIFESRGIHGWHNLLVGEWVDIFQGNRNGWRPATDRYAPKARFVNGGVQLKGYFYRNDSSQPEFARITDSRYLPSRTLRIPMASSGATTSTLSLNPSSGDLHFGGGFGGTFVSVDGIFYPLN